MSPRVASIGMSAAAILAFAGASQAGYLTLTGKFTDSLAKSVNIDAPAGLIDGNVNTVQFHWTRTDHAGAGVDKSVPITFDTYCVDLKQTVKKGDTYTYDVIPLASAGFTATQVSLLGTLWAENESKVKTATDSAAFQVAIWEILYDTNYNVSTGNFKLNSPLSVRTASAAMLSSAVADRGKSTPANLVVLRSDCAQDQLCQLPPSIPTPGSAVLGAAGLLMAMPRRRKQA